MHPLVTELHANVWGEGCSPESWGAAHGRRAAAVPQLLRAAPQVEAPLSAPQRGRGNSFFPACCYSGFGFIFSIPSGAICT